MTVLKRALAVLLTAALLMGLTGCDLSFLYPAEESALSGSAEDMLVTDSNPDNGEADTTGQKATKTTKKGGKVTNPNEGDSDFAFKPITTTKKKTGGKKIAILAIGNSFSMDSLINHMYPLLESAGYGDITLANLHVPGCTIETHWANINGEKKEYEFQVTKNGKWDRIADYTAQQGIRYADWDYITIQQGSHESGMPNSYADLQHIASWVKANKPKAKLFFHMTWAYEQTSDHWAFGRYNKDQMTMYRAITSAVQTKAVPIKQIDGVIPSGTAIQNLRTSPLGDTLTSDGYHLPNSYGDYTASMTWYCALTGGKPESVTYRPTAVEQHWRSVARAVKNAVTTPYEVTPV